MTEVVAKLKQMSAMFEKILKVSPDNPCPHNLDSQPSVVEILNNMKEKLKDVEHYAEDYKKRNFVTRKAVASKTKKKLDNIINNLATYMRLLENVAFTHNSQTLQQMAIEQSNSNLASELQGRI
mmetsp:Transcript_17020/g.26282  ORF Transcript_17020/g.26282 Transcript_17020/m.26282 type:complete len:124 (+) Transcript_17020:153-524(+)